MNAKKREKLNSKPFNFLSLAATYQAIKYFNNKIISTYVRTICRSDSASTLTNAMNLEELNCFCINFSKDHFITKR